MFAPRIELIDAVEVPYRTVRKLVWNGTEFVPILVYRIQGHLKDEVHQCYNVQTSSVVVPVAQKHASFATLLLGLGRGPFYKIQTVIVVCLTVGFESKMYVCKDRGFFK